MSDKPTKPDNDDLGMAPRTNRRVLLDAPDLQVPADQVADQVVRKSAVERAKEEVAMGTVEEEVDLDSVLDSLLPEL